MRLIFSFALVVFLPFPALAQEPDSYASTRIDVDQDAHVIRFIVQGEEVAQFTSSGMLVPGDINYGGVIRDGGGVWIEEQMNNNVASSLDEDGGDADAE